MSYLFKNAQAEVIVLVDGSSYLFRAFHALPHLTNHLKEPTGAILGVMNMLKHLIEEYPSTHIVVVFDAKGPTFRHTLYPEYKAHRPPMPKILAEQIKPLHTLIEAYGLPLLIVPGVEADDVIGSLSRTAKKSGMNVIISTGDKDLTQLVDDQVILVDTMHDTILDEQSVFEKMGIKPYQVVDYLSLMGDSSDNIPGIPKVGKVTASKWLNQYDNLDNLILHSHEISGKIGEALRENLSILPLARKLTTIQQDVPLSFELNEAMRRPIQEQSFVALLQHFGFNSWLKQVSPDIQTPQKTYVCIQDESLWQIWKAKICQAKILAFDTETTALEPMHAKLVGISFAVNAHEACYIPLRHNPLTTSTQLPCDWMRQELKLILENPRIPKVGQHLKYDLEILEHEGIFPTGLLCDTMLASYVLESGLTRHDLATLAKRHLNCDSISYEAVTGKGAKKIPFADVPLEHATKYACEDADLTLRLADIFLKKLSESPRLNTVFLEEEMPLLSVLKRMEQTGVLIDATCLLKQSMNIEQKVKALENQAYQLAGAVFNLSSPKQLREILFERMKLPILQKTPTGEASTAEDVLEEMAQDFELPRIILEHRHLSKLKSTYTDKLPKEIHEITGRIHTSYHQTGANTGRLASANPNLQNIPIRSEEGRRIRAAFIAKKDFVILATDYSQIELRIMAHLSGDSGLQLAFHQNIDIHRATASEVFGVPYHDIDEEKRRRAKAINFGLIYGMSGFGLAKQLGIDRAQAEAYIEVYFLRYPGVKDYMERTREQAKSQGYVETLFGRRLYLPEIHSANGLRRKAAERAAINAPMQGTAADIIKRAMIRIDHWIQENAKETVQMIMQVHDELVFEVKASMVSEMQPIIVAHMENAAELQVPLIASCHFGQNWSEAH